MILFVLPPCRAALPAAGQQPDADRRDRPDDSARPAAGRSDRPRGTAAGRRRWIRVARKARGSKGRLADARGYAARSRCAAGTLRANAGARGGGSARALRGPRLVRAPNPSQGSSGKTALFRSRIATWQAWIREGPRGKHHKVRSSAPPKETLLARAVRARTIGYSGLLLRRVESAAPLDHYSLCEALRTGLESRFFSFRLRRQLCWHDDNMIIYEVLRYWR